MRRLYDSEVHNAHVRSYGREVHDAHVRLYGREVHNAHVRLHCGEVQCAHVYCTYAREVNILHYTCASKVWRRYTHTAYEALHKRPSHVKKNACFNTTVIAFVTLVAI